MQAPRVGVYSGEELGAYGYEEKPWFLPQVRLHAFLEELHRRGLDARVSMLPAPRAEDADLLRFHTAEHVARVRRLCAANEGALDHGPTFARASVETAATHVVGAVADATRRLLAGDLDRAFVPIAGFHHAHRAEARNYCLYNDAAIAVALLLEQGVAPIAYVDIDAHHGDGVYDAFASEPRVLIADVHQDGHTLWPNSPESPGTDPVSGERADRGDGPAQGTKLNIPLQPGSTDEDLRTAFDEIEASSHRARRASSSSRAAPTAWPATRSLPCPSPPTRWRTRRADWPSSPTAAPEAACWCSAGAATTSPRSAPPGARSSKPCWNHD